VIYTPFLQEAFSTVSLSVGDWLFCVDGDRKLGTMVARTK
jgi:hypothetical protein